MAILLSTIKPENLVAKHPTGRTATPKAVKDIGDGKYQYSFLESWNSGDTGVWEVWLDASNQVLDVDGNAIAVKKIAEFTVDIAINAEYIVVVPWGVIQPTPAQVIFTAGPPPAGDWLLCVDVRTSATKRTTRLWAQVGAGVAKPLLVLEDTLTTPTHADAVVQPDGSFQNAIGDLELSYRTTLNPQNEGQMTMTFPSGLITRVDLEGQDAQGTALELGGQAIGAGSTSVNLTPFMGNALVTQILFKITFADNSITQYLIPLSR